MTTVHESTAAELLADMVTDPDEVAALAQVAEGLRHHRYPASFVAVVGQTREQPAYWPPEQTAAFTYVTYRLAHGLIARRRIPVGATPRPDSDREGNAARLSSIARPFAASLDMEQNGADSDGILTWGQPVTAWRATGVRILNAHVQHGTIHAPFDLKPYSVPLEVGYTKPSRTMHHLLTEGAVARWAYDSTAIDLLINIERIGGFVAARHLPAGVELIRPL